MQSKKGPLVRLKVLNGASAESDIRRPPAPPAWDGIAVGGDGLFAALKDGKVLKLAASAP